MDDGFWTDPSKEAFIYKMLEDTKDWERDDASAKMKIVQLANKKMMEKDDAIVEMLMMGKDPKVVVLFGIVTVLAKIWLPKEIFQEIKDVFMVMLAVIFVGLVAKIVGMHTKIYEIAKTTMEELALFKERFIFVQILMMKIEMSLVQKGGNVNRLLKMVADKVSQLEYRFMDSSPRPDDTGRKITNFLEANYTASKSYMFEGLCMYFKDVSSNM